jgi:hypothetical protein
MLRRVPLVKTGFSVERVAPMLRASVASYR